MKIYKIVLVGDGTVGKTCLIRKYIEDIFTNEYKPTICDTYSAQLKIGTVKVNFFDVAGQEDYERVRASFYPDTDLFIILYAVNNLTSFYNIRNYWLPELITKTEKKEYKFEIGKTGLDKPCILVATKIDVRNYAEYFNYKNIVEKCVSKEMGENLAKELGCKFVECSSFTGDGISLVVDTAIDALEEMKEGSKNKKCIIC
jgi:small GTP-binding protein